MKKKNKEIFVVVHTYDDGVQIEAATTLDKAKQVVYGIADAYRGQVEFEWDGDFRYVPTTEGDAGILITIETTELQ